MNWMYLKSQLKTFPFGQMSIKYEIWKLMFVQCLKIKYGLNKM
jgi:hypothetical protein